MIITTSLMTLGATIDMIWVGRMGSASIAGVGVAGMIVMLVNSMLTGLFTSLRAMIARGYWGQRRPECYSCRFQLKKSLYLLT